MSEWLGKGSSEYIVSEEWANEVRVEERGVAVAGGGGEEEDFYVKFIAKIINDRSI